MIIEWNCGLTWYQSLFSSFHKVPSCLIGVWRRPFVKDLYDALNDVICENEFTFGEAYFIYAIVEKS